LVKGAHKGEGLGNQFLHHIRECDAICEVIRDFKDENIIHVDGSIDPDRDKETINLELTYADLQIIEKRLDKLSKDAKSGNKDLILQKELFEKAKKHLDAGRGLRDMPMSGQEKIILKGLGLLTLKPIIYVINKAGGNLIKNEGLRAAGGDGKTLALDIKQEEEIAALPEEEQAEYINELGLEQSGLDRLVRASYGLLGLITFFTTGPDETRAWTVKSGSKAPQAAGVIHTDFEKGFIRAEVIPFENFIEYGGEVRAREKGLIRTEGKDYIVKDGDICHFLFSK